MQNRLNFGRLYFSSNVQISKLIYHLIFFSVFCSMPQTNLVLAGINYGIYLFSIICFSFTTTVLIFRSRSSLSLDTLFLSIFFIIAYCLFYLLGHVSLLGLYVTLRIIPVLYVSYWISNNEPKLAQKLFLSIAVIYAIFSIVDIYLVLYSYGTFFVEREQWYSLYVTYYGFDSAQAAANEQIYNLANQSLILIVLFIKFSNISKLHLITMSLLAFKLVISTFFSPIIMLLVFFNIYLFGFVITSKSIRFKIYFLVFIFTFCALVVLTYFNLPSDSRLYVRLDLLYRFLFSGESISLEVLTSNRDYLITKSFDVWLDNLIFGVGDSNNNLIGGHSSLFDYLALYGIILGSIVLIPLYFAIKSIGVENTLRTKNGIAVLAFYITAFYSFVMNPNFNNAIPFTLFFTFGLILSAGIWSRHGER